MRKLLVISVNTIQGFATPALNFLIVVFGVKIFGKDDWASLINAMIWVFFFTFIFSWGNRDYLLRKYSENPAKIHQYFFNNLITRCLLLPLSLFLLVFFPLEIAIWQVALVILTFLYSSLGTLVVYNQKFAAQLISEFIGFVFIFWGVFFFKNFELKDFIQLYVLSTSIKLILLSVKLKLFNTPFSVKISIHEFKAGFPFFLLRLSGWLLSKTDIYIVVLYLDNTQLSEYQLLITAFLMLQALSAFITIPFTKHIYRISDIVIKKIKYKLYAVSLPVVLSGSFTIWIVMEYFVKLELNYVYYIVGGLFALPCFFYTINIMQLVKNHKEKHIIYMSFLAFIVSINLTLLLIKPYGILGVLIAACVTQWIILITYKLHHKFIS